MRNTLSNVCGLVGCTVWKTLEDSRVFDYFVNAQPYVRFRRRSGLTMGYRRAGMGKSTVGKMFVKHGVPVLDADQVLGPSDSRGFNAVFSRYTSAHAKGGVISAVRRMSHELLPSARGLGQHHCDEACRKLSALPQARVLFVLKGGWGLPERHYHPAPKFAPSRSQICKTEERST